MRLSRTHGISESALWTSHGSVCVKYEQLMHRSPSRSGWLLDSFDLFKWRAIYSTCLGNPAPPTNGIFVMWRHCLLYLTVVLRETRTRPELPFDRPGGMQLGPVSRSQYHERPNSAARILGCGHMGRIKGRPRRSVRAHSNMLRNGNLVNLSVIVERRSYAEWKGNIFSCRGDQTELRTPR